MTRTVPAPAVIRPRTVPIPVGFRLAVDASVHDLGAGVLSGGVPLRYLRLTAAGARAWTRLRTSPVQTRAEGLLARRLTDAGLAHPVPPSPALTDDVTVIVPVLDRPQALARCLSALGGAVPVVVVDDGSADPDAIAVVAAEHGARVIRREVNGGPAAARNTGLAALDRAVLDRAVLDRAVLDRAVLDRAVLDRAVLDRAVLDRAAPDHAAPDHDAPDHDAVVAFVDSDCVPPAGWLDPLLAHLADPLVAAVAPRIVATAGRTWAGRYTAARGNLDLGSLPSRVRPDARVSYVPTATLVARVSALRDVARGGYVFDPSLRYGEDVDLVWRLDDAGWRVRYQPDSCVEHAEPDTWPALLARRFRYGTSAAPLAAAHPDCTSPLILAPWPTVAVAALLGGRMLPAAVALASAELSVRRRLRTADLPSGGVRAVSARSVYRTWLGTGRYVSQFAAPVALVAVAAPGPIGRRLAAASLLLGGPLITWWPRRHALDPLRFTVGYLADEVAYGTGVWSAAARRRDLTALRPRLARHGFAAPACAPPSAPMKES